MKISNQIMIINQYTRISKYLYVITYQLDVQIAQFLNF